MTRATKFTRGVTIVALSVVAFATVPILRTSIPGRIARWCFGEPGATQWVHDTADKIVSSGSATELHEVSGKLMSEFGPIATTLPNEPFSRGRLLAIDRLPAKYRKLGGIYGDPDLVLRVNEDGSPVAIVISWGHMRQAIILFANPPLTPPQGYFVRRVNERTYVVANES
jgi:hypothetical protein